VRRSQRCVGEHGELPGAHAEREAPPKGEGAAMTGETEATAEPIEAPKRIWFRRHRLVIIVGAVSFVLGAAAGAGTAPEDLTAEVDRLEARGERLEKEAAQLSEELFDRAEQRVADEAAAARLQAEADAAARKKADDEAKAAAQKAAQEAAAAAARDTITRDGVYAIGPERNAGRWRTDGGSSCYWAILRAPSGGLGNIVDNGLPGGQAFVDLRDGQFFETTRCGTWTRIG
jgi:hypothetical protein